jgi:hypothetical protein
MEMSAYIGVSSLRDDQVGRRYIWDEGIDDIKYSWVWSSIYRGLFRMGIHCNVSWHEQNRYIIHINQLVLLLYKPCGELRISYLRHHPNHRLFY